MAVIDELFFWYILFVPGMLLDEHPLITLAAMGALLFVLGRAWGRSRIWGKGGRVWGSCVRAALLVQGIMLLPLCAALCCAGLTEGELPWAYLGLGALVWLGSLWCLTLALPDPNRRQAGKEPESSGR